MEFYLNVLELRDFENLIIIFDKLLNSEKIYVGLY